LPQYDISEQAQVFANFKTEPHLRAGWIENRGSALSRKPNAALCQVTQFDKHHCGHQCVIEGVVLSERGNFQVSLHGGKGEID
jgi:hypothetical protein